MAFPGPQTKITITHDREVAGDLQSQFITQVMSKEMQIAQLQTLFNQIGLGSRNGSIALTIDDGTAVAASGTLTFTGTSTAGDTFLLNGVTLTCVASGATNNQWNVGGGTVTQQAAAFVSAVNASSTSLISGQVLASNIAGVVTLTSNFLGIQGNAVTIAKGTDTGAVMAVSGARLTGGVASASSSSATTYKHGV